MTRYLVKIGFCLMFCGVVLLIFNIYERKFGNSRNKILSLKFQEKIELDCAVFGSSQLLRSIHTTKSKLLISNFSISNSAFNIDIDMARWYLRSHKPKIVVLEGSILYHLKKNTDEWRNQNNIDVFFNSKTIYSLDKLNTLQLPVQKKIKLVLSQAINENAILYDKSGYPVYTEREDFKEQNYNLKKIRNSRITRTKISVHNNYSLKHYNENIHLLNEFLIECKKDNIKVIFVSPPKHIIYNESFSPLVYQMRDAFLKEIGIHSFLNFEKLWERDSSKFSDINHMNLNGGNMFTKIIDRAIEEELLK
jgi:hypothetical protein